VLQAMAGEVGFDLKIRVTEFATSLNEAEQGRFQAYFVGWSGPHRPRRQPLQLPEVRRTAEQRTLL
jgi:ABC-type transport system substrate-binding protein